MYLDTLMSKYGCFKFLFVTNQYSIKIIAKSIELKSID